MPRKPKDNRTKGAKTLPSTELEELESNRGRGSSPIRSVHKKTKQITEWLDLATRTGSFVLFDWDPKRNTVEWSGDLEKVCGIAPRHWQEAFRIWDNLVHPEDLPRLMGELERAFRTREPYDLDYRIKWPDGSFHWICSRGAATAYDADGSPTRVIGFIQLIDKHKLEEEQLRRRTEELQTLMDVVPAAIWVAHDPECHDITGNVTANQMYEADAGENVSASAPEGAVQERRFFQKGKELAPEELPMQLATAKNADVRGAELEVIVPSGSSFTMLGSASPLRDESGNVRGCVAAFLDITPHKRAEEAVRESELRFRSMFERHKAVMLLVEPETGEIVAANAAASQFYGLSREELQGLRVQEINALPPSEVSAERQRALDECRNYFVFPHKLGNGEVRWVEVYSSPIEVQGRALLFSIIHDITDRRETERLLRTSEEHFRLLVEQASDGIFLTDARGHYLDVNTAGCEMLDYTRDEILSMAISDVVAPHEISRVAGLLADDPDGRVVRGEWVFRRKNGTLFAGEIAARRLPDGRLQTILRDVTDRKKADQALIRSEKLASAGRLAATIAHEVNNPLAAAVNAVYLARLDPKISADTKRFLTMAEEELRRATEITRQTLGFYRENGRSEPVRVNAIADTVLSLYNKRLDYKGLEVKRKYRCEPVAMIVPGELRQVIANLIANALDASDRGDEMHVRTSKVGASVSVTIADTGIGINEEQKKHIFEPFFTTKESVGTGLGLWVSSELVRKHGGRIRMRSKSGTGTVFSVFLPAVHDAIPKP